MKETAWIFSLGGFLVVLGSCVATAKAETRLGLILMVIDVPCDEIIEAISINLRERNIPSK